MFKSQKATMQNFFFFLINSIIVCLNQLHFLGVTQNKSKTNHARTILELMEKQYHQSKA